MVKVIILLRFNSRTSGDEENYNDLLMMFEALPGLRKKAVNNVYSGPGGLVPFRVVIELTFSDREALEAALTSEPGVAAGNALLKLAGPDAVTLFADVMEEDFPRESSSPPAS
jgi:hypothetical protein